MADISTLSNLAGLAAVSTSNSRAKKQIGYQVDAQKELMSNQNLLNIANYDYQVDTERKLTEENWAKYNSPAAQKQALLDAGISPDAIGGVSGGSTGNSGASIGGVSIPGAPAVDYDPIGDAMKTASFVHQIASQALSNREAERAYKYNVDAQELELQRLSSEAKQANAQAVIAEKEAGVFDSREYRRTRQDQDAHVESMRRSDQMLFDNLFKLSRDAREEREQSNRDRTTDSSIKHNDTQDKALNAATSKTEKDMKYLENNGYYPGSGPSLIGSLLDVLLPGDKNSGRTSEALSNAGSRFKKISRDLSDSYKSHSRTRSENDYRDQGLMEIAYEHGDTTIRRDSKGRYYQLDNHRRFR